MQRVMIFVVILPLLTSVVVRTFAWIVILGRGGVINHVVLWLGFAQAPLRLLQTELGLVVALTQIEMPLMLLPLSACWAASIPISGTHRRRSRPRSGARSSRSRSRSACRAVSPAAPGLRQLDHALHLAVDHRGQPPRLSAPADLQQSLVVYNWPLASVAALTLLLSVSPANCRSPPFGRRGTRHLHV